MILIVDDDKQNTTMLLGVLDGRHTCKVVGDASGALTAITAEPVDLVLLDIDLAGGSGVALGPAAVGGVAGHGHRDRHRAG